MLQASIREGKDLVERKRFVKIKVVSINARFTHSCLALFYLRQHLEAHIAGVEVELCHYTINDPYYTLLQRIDRGNPDYVFFSALIWNSMLIERLLADLPAINGACRYVVGGPQAPVLKEKFAGSGRISFFCGDIEAAGDVFFRDLERGKPGIMYSGSFFKEGITRFDYPYRDDDFTGPLKNRHVYYESSRGCPFSCSYCCSAMETGVFHKDLDQVFVELDHILSFSPKVVRFLDRTFNDNRKRALRIWNYLAVNGEGTLFHFEIAPEQFDEEMLCFLAGVEPGRFQFEIGIQSTNQKTLDAISRKMSVDRAAEVVKKLRIAENIHLHVDLILGLPYETADTYAASLNEVFRMNPHYIQMGLLKLLPDTPIYRQREQFGYQASVSPPYSFFSNSWLSSADARALYWLGECVEMCVNNRYFKSFWSYLSLQKEDMATFFSTLSRTFLQQGWFWKAATQETLSALLAGHTGRRSDSSLLLELLCFDWLRCGHHFLPEHLKHTDVDADKLRKWLFRELPDEIDGCFGLYERKAFFKKGFFYLFSRETLAYLGYEVNASRAVLRFSSERENSVDRLHEVEMVMDFDRQAFEQFP